MLNAPFDYFEIKINELQRQNRTMRDGTILVLTDSFGNFFSPVAYSPYMMKLDCYGTNFRHLIREFYRIWQDVPLSAPDGGMLGMAHRAGAMVFFGMVANALLDEMFTAGHTEAQAYANIDYALTDQQDAGNLSWPYGLFHSIGGKGVFVCGTPTRGLDQYATNARIYHINEFTIKPIVARKPGWAVVDLNETFAPGWHANGGALLIDQYWDGVSNAEPSKAMMDVIFNDPTGGVIAKLASVGVMA